jgi:hypothetical protein
MVLPFRQSVQNLSAMLIMRPRRVHCPRLPRAMKTARHEAHSINVRLHAGRLEPSKITVIGSESQTAAESIPELPPRLFNEKSKVFCILLMATALRLGRVLLVNVDPPPPKKKAVGIHELDQRQNESPTVSLSGNHVAVGVIGCSVLVLGSLNAH